jgi:hypothetical protein
MHSQEQNLLYYLTFIDNPNNRCELTVAALAESYQWLTQSFEESKSAACSFRELSNGYEFSCLNDLVKTSVEVNGGSIKKVVAVIPLRDEGSLKRILEGVKSIKGRQQQSHRPIA